MKVWGRGLLIAVFAMVLGIFSATGGIAPKEILEKLDAAKLESAAAVKVTGKTLELGTVKIVLEEGVLVPAEAIDGRRLEIAFVGKGKFQYAPPDPVEIGQLKLFTGNQSLDETFGAAVFAGLPADSGILDGEPAGDPAGWPRDKAEELFKAWLASPDRQVVGVRDSLLQLASGDPAMQDYRAVWVRGEKLKDFLLCIDPQAYEQVRLDQFKRWELDEQMRWKLLRSFRFDMRAGRMAALDFEMLGGLDLWVSVR